MPPSARPTTQASFALLRHDACTSSPAEQPCSSLDARGGGGDRSRRAKLRRAAHSDAGIHGQSHVWSPPAPGVSATLTDAGSAGYLIRHSAPSSWSQAASSSSLACTRASACRLPSSRPTRRQATRSTPRRPGSSPGCGRLPCSAHARRLRRCTRRARPAALPPLHSWSCRCSRSREEQLSGCRRGTAHRAD